MYAQANIMNTKKLNTSIKISMANVATNRISKLTMVVIKMAPPLIEISQV